MSYTINVTLNNSSAVRLALFNVTDTTVDPVLVVALDPGLPAVTAAIVTPDESVILRLLATVVSPTTQTVPVLGEFTVDNVAQTMTYAGQRSEAYGLPVGGGLAIDAADEVTLFIGLTNPSGYAAGEEVVCSDSRDEAKAFVRLQNAVAGAAEMDALTAATMAAAYADCIAAGGVPVD